MLPMPPEKANKHFSFSFSAKNKGKCADRRRKEEKKSMSPELNKWNGAIFVKLFSSWIIHYACLPIKRQRHVCAEQTKPFTRWQNGDKNYCVSRIVH